MAFVDPLGLAKVDIVDYAKKVGATTEFYTNKDGKKCVSVTYKGITKGFSYSGSGKIEESTFNEKFGIKSTAPAITVTETKDRITINATIHIKYDKNQDAEWNTRYRNLALDGIKEYWSGSYKGKPVDVELTFIEDIKKRKKGQEYITIYLKHYVDDPDTDERERGYSFALVDVDPATKISTSWSRDNVGGLVLYDHNSQYPGGKWLDDTEFAKTAAHEFGHNLGLGDAYLTKPNSLEWRAWSDKSSIMNNQSDVNGATVLDYANVLKVWKTGNWHKW